MKEKDVGQELTQFIRQLVQDEVKKILNNKVEYSTKGRVININQDGTVDVYIIESDINVYRLKNETGHTLEINNYVKVYYTQNNYNNGYIGYKF